jgi:cytoskeletal protein CcmA (bactofilin family)
MMGSREKEVRKEPAGNGSPGAISIIGPGMEVVGDCLAEGTLRVEGTLVGTVYAGKGVVVGKEGLVRGEIRTHDALIAGEVTGRVLAASRLEIQSTARVQGEIRARRFQLEEGAVLNGEIHMGEVELGTAPKSQKLGAGGKPPQRPDQPQLKMESPKPDKVESAS